jgi:DNA-binding NtrC family response regulator
LVDYFLERLAKNCGRTINEVSAGAMRTLLNYSWPGNVRELRTLLERVVILGRGDALELDDLPPEVRYGGTALSNGETCPFVLPDDGVNLETVEQSLIRQALTRTEGNQSAAARLLGITRFALRYRVEKYGITE